MDLPSAEDPAIASQISSLQNFSAYQGLHSLSLMVSLAFQVLSQASVFTIVLYNQPSMLIYVAFNLLQFIPFTSEGIDFYNTSKLSPCSSDSSTYGGFLSVGCNMQRSRLHFNGFHQQDLGGDDTQKRNGSRKPFRLSIVQ